MKPTRAIRMWRQHPARLIFQRTLWHIDAQLLLRALAAGLIHAVVYWPSAAFDLVLPLRPGLELQVRPGLVVPLFVGLTQGPVVGALTGVVGQLLGELMAARVSSGTALVIGLLQSGLFGLLAGLGRPTVRAFRDLSDLGRVLAWSTLAGLGGQLLPLLIVLGLMQLRPDIRIDLNVILSGGLTALVNAWLLMPILFLIWERVRTKPPE